MRKTVVIICDGQFPKSEYPRYLIRTADFLVCCDGALRKFIRNSKGIFGAERLPDLVIGDMDTLPVSWQKKYADIIIRETEQEHNDQTKAVRWVLGNIPDIDYIYILGSTGGRADHTIGNLSLLMEYTRMFDLGEITIEAVTDEGTAFAVNDTTEFDCGIGRQVSIFSPDNSLNIRSEGLEYQTEGVIFDNWWKATLNKAVRDNVRLEFSHRSMALIILD
ncbi:MAG: thiamine diphosphokinase [Bacteroidales bacterium]|nr:thiamine diphosphokinase [Bacteroidales bacterium]